jgi:putative endonuclease
MITQKQPAVYIMTNIRNGTLYTGVTSNLVKRVHEHRNGLMDGFTKKYSCKILVFFEIHETMESAIGREKQIKLYTRKKKIQLIEIINSQWRDLYSGIV